ncbi:uncharacterized protein BO97DRAFT_452875 [Aspergillus homomorphus CBS 101889]|uniref:MFS general substrate transporter n=1 Tax=Aspergillus homomorphus (strain CBS 101889) TaxID=1450537 RepID=A0A395IA30_ASPHC|nr:hypothetical protein BO97DRAFT_452875 [Aspergillus homomorphus CBS 101889]RAL16886.1 hypothetical protein BO97DRAFT_452875 [Aspergillus homomorphus CBS 101889]
MNSEPLPAGFVLRDPLLDFDEHGHARHPQDWSIFRRTWATFLSRFNLVTISNSTFSEAQASIEHEFALSEEVTVLGTSLFLVGYLIGPLVFGPISERFGRKYSLVAGVAVSSAFSLMPAIGKRLETILIGGLLADFFESWNVEYLILQRAAKRYRNHGHPHIRSQLEVEGVSLSHLARAYLVRPWSILIFYLFYQSYPVAFGDICGWNPSLSSLSLIGIIAGLWGGTFAVVVFTQAYLRYQTGWRDNNFQPEIRLSLMIVGGCLVPAELFRYAWTSNPAIPWPSEGCAGVLIGLGMSIIFIQCFTYIIDCYPDKANRVIAANGAVRSMLGHLQFAWATSLVGFLRVILIPVSVLL